MNVARCLKLALGLPAIVVALTCLAAPPVAHAAGDPGRSIIPTLEERLGLSNSQVQGALAALLVFARERLTKSDFDDLAKSIPNAARLMQNVKLSGVVNGPLDDMDEYEAALAHLGIGQPLASQIVPAVIRALDEAGHPHERAILERIAR